MEVTHITNEKIQKIDDEIIKVKSKIAAYTAKLRKLENEKTDKKNAEFLAIVNGADVSPNELMAFIKAQREQSSVDTTEIPNIPPDSGTTKNDKEGNGENT